MASSPGSADPLAAPAIHAGYLTDPDDVAPLVDGEGRPALAHYAAGSGRWQLRPVGPLGLRTGAQAGGDGNLVVVWGGSAPGDE